jgi:hypothetical protein
MSHSIVKYVKIPAIAGTQATEGTPANSRAENTHQEHTDNNRDGNNSRAASNSEKHQELKGHL